VSNPTIRYRYEVGDAHSFDLNEAASTMEAATEIAARESMKRGHSVVIYDRMAKHGYPCEWAVQRDGSAHVVRVKPEAKP
jgi:hypothetical protein